MDRYGRKLNLYNSAAIIAWPALHIFACLQPGSASNMPGVTVVGGAPRGATNLSKNVVIVRHFSKAFMPGLSVRQLHANIIINLLIINFMVTFVSYENINLGCFESMDRFTIQERSILRFTLTNYRK
jgi:hypothetical protein